MQEIKFYSNSKEYRWLSNFYNSYMTIDGIEYYSVEHYYQSQKFTDELRDWIIKCPESKYLYLVTRMLKKYQIPNWDNIKFDVMLKGLREKFSQNLELKKRLLDTGDSILHEDSSDKVWGIKGEDMLGILLMKVRDEMKNGKD